MAQIKTLLSHCQSCDEHKPEINQYSNSRKGGLDALDQMVRYYSIKIMTPKWPMVSLFNKIDISAMIAIIVRVELHSSLHCQKGVRRICLSH